jgi:hypothetical protein
MLALIGPSAPLTSRFAENFLGMLDLACCLILLRGL